MEDLEGILDDLNQLTEQLGIVYENGEDEIRQLPEEKKKDLRENASKIQELLDQIGEYVELILEFAAKPKTPSA